MCHIYIYTYIRSHNARFAAAAVTRQAVAAKLVASRPPRGRARWHAGQSRRGGCSASAAGSVQPVAPGPPSESLTLCPGQLAWGWSRRPRSRVGGWVGAEKRWLQSSAQTEKYYSRTACTFKSQECHVPCSWHAHRSWCRRRKKNSWNHFSSGACHPCNICNIKIQYTKNWLITGVKSLQGRPRGTWVWIDSR